MAKQNKEPITQLNFTVSKFVMDGLLSMQARHGIKNRSKFIRELIRLGMPAFERKLSEQEAR